MIRINLLPAAETRKRAASGQGQTFVLIFGALVVFEVLGLFMWYQSVEEEVGLANQQATKAEKEVKRLEEAKKQLEEREKAKIELSRQNIIFEQLKARQTGPPEMLQFLSYALTKKEDNLYNRDEIKAQEAAGWATNWDPRNVWISEFRQSDYEIDLKGLARSRQDAAEFVRRLSSSVYYLIPDMPADVKVTDEIFKQLPLVEFEVTTVLNYQQDGVFKMVRADVPERLVPYIPAAPTPPPDDGKKKGRGAKGNKERG
jgi:Tfp pilus assembly protein PilN